MSGGLNGDGVRQKRGRVFMKRLNVELIVGLFLILGLVCFFYLAIKMGNIGIFEDDTYSLTARFTSTSGLKEGAFVELAGVQIGKVTRIEVDPKDYLSVVQFSIPDDIKLQDDSIISVRTAGIIGDKFLKLSPGGSEEYLKPGDEIYETESSINLEELVSKYIFESDKK
jgi:phospholipid/cholesterol/gamma-HCH transport system substrate-binding protein